MRIKFLDVAKGLSILLVVLGHSHLLGSINQDPANAALGTFRVPFFFFISGVFFSYHKRLSSYAFDKFDALVKPFFAVLLLNLLLMQIGAGRLPTPAQILAIFYGNGATLGEPWVPLWFLPHLWVVFLFASLLLKRVQYDKQKLVMKVALLALLLVLGSTGINLFWELDLTSIGLPISLPGLPFSLDLVLFTAFFFILGYSLRASMATFRPNFYLFALGSLCIYLAAYHFGALVDLNNRLLVNPFFALLSALCGIYCGLTVALFLAKVRYLNQIFTYLGQQSLFILLFHTPVYHLVLVLGFGEPTLLAVVTSVILCLLISLGMGFLISKNALLSLLFRPFKTNQWLQQHRQRAADPTLPFREENHLPA